MNTLVRYLRSTVALRDRSPDLYECRQCGTTLEDDPDCCSECGSEEIASYDL